MTLQLVAGIVEAYFDVSFNGDSKQLAPCTCLLVVSKKIYLLCPLPSLNVSTLFNIKSHVFAIKDFMASVDISSYLDYSLSRPFFEEDTHNVH